jgi:transglutaminase-like putative cysteine protease
MRSFLSVLATALAFVIGSVPVARADELLFQQTLVVALQGVEVGKIEGKDTKTKDGIEIQRSAVLELSRGVTKNKVTTNTLVKLTPDRKPVSFVYTRTDAAGTLKLEGKMVGDTLELVGGPSATKQTLPLKPGTTFALALEHETRVGLKDGFKAERPVVLEEMGAVATMTVDVKKRGAGFLVISSFQGLTTEEEVDAKGNTLVSRTPGVGIVAYPPGRAPADLAKGNADLLAVSTWKTKVVRPPVTVVRYRVLTETAAQFVVPEDDRQKVTKRDSKSLEIEVRAGVSSKAPLSAERRKKLLESTPYEAVQDPAIVKAASNATQGAKDKRDEISKLTRFVFDHVEAKGLDRGYAAATQTLASKAGDCTEHSVLLSALLRARGIPTRLVDGVVVDGDRAGYHEWVEAYVDGEGFVAADPTFGQFPAGPERLKLAEGSTSPDEHLALSLAAARLLGQRVTLEVIEAK